MNKTKYALVALLAVSLIVGCGIATGSFTFVYEIDDTITSTHASLEYEYVDLTTIEDYEDHQDNLHSLDNVAVVGCFTNTGSEPFSGEVWLAYDTVYATYGANGPDSVRTYGTRIFTTFSPIITDVLLCVDWEDGLMYIENFSEIQTAVLDSAHFVIYGLGDSDDFEMEMDIDIIFTITAGL